METCIGDGNSIPKSAKGVFKMSKLHIELFEELAQPDINGHSRAVSVDEFVDQYIDLRLGNGGGWCRDDGPLGRKYKVNRIKQGNKIVAIKLEGHADP